MADLTRAMLKFTKLLNRRTLSNSFAPQVRLLDQKTCLRHSVMTMRCSRLVSWSLKRRCSPILT